MASIRLPRMPGRGKPAARLPGVRDPPPSPGFRPWVLVFMGLVPRTPANGLPDRHRDIMHYVSKAPRKRLACGLCTIVLSSYGTHGFTTILTRLNRRHRHGSARGPSAVHT
jgi:hypothetical protein